MSVCCEAYLVKVQADDDVGLLRLLVHHLQEVDVADVCGESNVKDITGTCAANRDKKPARLQLLRIRKRSKAPAT